jgi:serine/threonine protein kinase
MLYRFFFKKEIIIKENEDMIIPENKNEYLRDLLYRILKYNPKERLSMEEITNHFFFNSYFEIDDENSYKNNEYKILALEKFLFHYKKNQQKDNSGIEIFIRRKELISDVFNNFSKFNHKDILKKIKITFNNEDGYDLNGLTTSLFSQFFNKIVEEKYGNFIFNIY